jgi:hypothetical protein
MIGINGITIHILGKIEIFNGEKLLYVRVILISTLKCLNNSLEEPKVSN